MLRISAVMPVRDRFDLARAALASILAQSEKPFEIVVVDDGSIEPFEDHLGDLRRQGDACGILFQVLRHATSEGVSAARNHGFSASSGDLVCFCDSDDFWDHKKLETVRKLFKSKAEIKILFHSFRWDHDNLRAFRLLPQGKLMMLPRWFLVSVALLNPSCMSIKRSAFRDGFRVDMRHCEDLEFFLRLSKIDDIWLFNLPLTHMSRAPGSAGGASFDEGAMRRGAVQALQQCVSPTLVGLLAFAKIAYHKAKLRNSGRGIGAKNDQ